jgi:hypothetical protein
MWLWMILDKTNTAVPETAVWMSKLLEVDKESFNPLFWAAGLSIYVRPTSAPQKLGNLV